MDESSEQLGRRPGRPSEGANLVAALSSGSSLAKARLEAILRTLEGEWTIEDACEHLAIGRTAFHKMRNRFLEESTALLEPRKRGPKPLAETIDASEVQALRTQIHTLEIDVLAAETREELALASPAIAKEAAPSPSSARSGQKGGRGKRRKRKRRSR